MDGAKQVDGGTRGYKAHTEPTILNESPGKQTDVCCESQKHRCIVVQQDKGW